MLTVVLTLVPVAIEHTRVGLPAPLRAGDHSPPVDERAKPATAAEELALLEQMWRLPRT